MRYSLPVFIWLPCTLAVLNGCGPQAPVRTSPQPAATDESAKATLTGTASCSGRACHGSIEPHTGQLILQNEHTTWITLDRHTTAYAVLKTERSQRIARNLQLSKPAEQAQECLICHTTPQAAIADSFVAIEERRTGVGCESCHGSAVDYLALHTTVAWTGFTRAEKQKHGMTPLDDLSVRAATCAGCHIGSGPGNGLPARDVNHDLIAAGHPRLNFEFAAFTANTPPHWNAAAKRIDETRFWAIGQLASAQAALDLLEYRAKPDTAGLKPWPEFAEYDCYACHHLLLSDSSRQKRGYGSFLPGSLPWNDWYYYMPQSLAKLPGGPGNARVQDSLAELQKLMRIPDPNRARIAERAGAAASAVKQWQQEWTASLPPRKELRPFILAQPRVNWDQATQFYLGLSALADPDNATEQAALESIYRYLQFRTAEEFRYHSPRDFRVDDFDQLLKVLPR